MGPGKIPNAMMFDPLGEEPRRRAVIAPWNRPVPELS